MEEQCQHVWIETDLYCEDCGSHFGVICDECLETYDSVWDDEYDLVIAELEKNGER